MRNWHFKINLYYKPLATERNSLGLDSLLCLVLCGLIRSKGDFSQPSHPKISSSLTLLCVVCGLRGWQVHNSFRHNPVGVSCRMLLTHFHRIILWLLIFQTHPDRVVIQGAKQASKFFLESIVHTAEVIQRMNTEHRTLALFYKFVAHCRQVFDINIRLLPPASKLDLNSAPTSLISSLCCCNWLYIL